MSPNLNQNYLGLRYTPRTNKYTLQKLNLWNVLFVLIYSVVSHKLPIYAIDWAKVKTFTSTQLWNSAKYLTYQFDLFEKMRGSYSLTAPDWPATRVTMAVVITTTILSISLVGVGLGFTAWELLKLRDSGLPVNGTQPLTTDMTNSAVDTGKISTTGNKDQYY